MRVELFQIPCKSGWPSEVRGIFHAPSPSTPVAAPRSGTVTMAANIPEAMKIAEQRRRWIGWRIVISISIEQGRTRATPPCAHVNKRMMARDVWQESFSCRQSGSAAFGILVWIRHA